MTEKEVERMVVKEKTAEPSWFGRENKSGFREEFKEVRRTRNLRIDMVGVMEAENGAGHFILVSEIEQF